MSNNTNVLLNWLKKFQTIWLPENIPTDSHLLESIQTKIHELEQIIIENNEDEEEYHRAKLLNDHSSSNSDIEQIAVASTSAHEVPSENSLNISHQSDNENQEEEARQILLEQSDCSDNQDDNTILLRPSIRLKRISQADAERYMPSVWKNGHEISFDDNEKTKPNNNKSSTTSSTSDNDDDDDFNIKIRTRKSLLNKTEKSSIKLRKHTKNSSRKKTNDIIINYNPSAILNEPTLDDSLTIDEDISPMDEDRILKDVIENNDNESIFASLDIAQDKPMETNSNDEGENIANDEIDQLPTEDSSDDRPPIEVPSYAHLLHRSKSSSDSENAKKKSSSNEKNKSKRLITSSPNSDATPIKKKTKVGIKKQRVAFLSLSSSSDENENDLTLKTRNDDSSTSQQNSPLTASRIRIQCSSSSSSEDSNNNKSKRSRQRRKKTVISSERSKILKQIKRKALEKKSSKSSTTSDNNSDNQSKTKKSKRSGNNDDDDDDDDDDDKTTTDDEEGSSSKRKRGRKNIRKILDDKELDIQTKDAIEAERERRKRIAEKQKKYNDCLLEQSSYMANSTDEPITDTNSRLILELDKTTNEPLIEVSPKLVEQLKPHQCDGVRFLWNNVFESIDAIQNKKHQGNGCILAHCMGLGKTLQVITFIHTIFNYQKITNVKTCLVLCPINAALNWSNEFEYWLNDIEPSIDHYQLTTIKPNLRVSHLNYWYENGGVVIMGYELYRRLANGFGIKNKKLKAEAFQCLVDPGPDIIVADEGHILKNAQTALAKCLSKIKTPRRIVLTGTPLQNNLIEYYCMVSFIKPSLLGSQGEYINRFVNPIQNGQHRDSNEDDVRLMKRRACVLHELLTGFVDRKDYSLLKEYLPPKYEYIINIRLSDLQSKLYEIYLEKIVNKEQRLSVQKQDFKSAKLFADYQYLQKIWTHPFLLYAHFIDRWKKRLNTDDDSLVDDNELEPMFIDDEENVEGKKKKSNNKQNKSELENSFSGFLIDNIKNENDEIRSTRSKSTKRRNSNSSTTTLDSDCQDDDDNVNGENNSNSKTSDDDMEVIKTYPTRSRTTINNQQKSTSDNEEINNEEINSEDNSDQPWLDEMREQFWFPFLDMLPEESEFDIELSGKFLLLKYILDKCTEIGDKIILFSRSLYTLNHIEKFLHHLQIQNDKEYESQKQLRELLSSNTENENISNEPIPEPVQWTRDQDYFRMDGQTEVTTRKRYAKAFNDTSNLRARLFLISTLAGGMGINLVGSNRVIVFDASWNPSHDTQAIFRSYRFGQKKPVFIYRFLAHGTMEEKIYQRQVVKQSLSQRVIDDHQLDRHFTENDIKELYKFQSERLPDVQTTSTPLNFNYSIPKDHLLLDLLYEHNRWIHSYHSHDSLLENKLDEGLTAEERRRALEEYENLKRLPDQRQIALQRFQQQQRLNALIAQQQQLAAATHATRVQQLYPEIYQALRNLNGQQYDYTRLVQHLQTLGVMNETQNTNHNKKTTVSAGPVPILPRPTTNADSNVVILVESDEEQNGDTIPK